MNVADCRQLHSRYMADYGLTYQEALPYVGEECRRLMGDDADMPLPGTIYVLGKDADYQDSPSGPNWPGKTDPKPDPNSPVNPRPTFLQQFADIMDAIPEAPGFAPVAKSECAWCRVTKKLAPWLGFVVVGLIVAWLSRKLFRR
jgi:hypothetical protein